MPPPGLGGSFAASFQAAGYDTAAQLRVLSAAQLVERFGLRPAAAEVVVRWARGEDPRPVQERGPPKAIQARSGIQSYRPNRNPYGQVGPR